MPEAWLMVILMLPAKTLATLLQSFIAGDYDTVLNTKNHVVGRPPEVLAHLFAILGNHRDTHVALIPF
jgi:hypothetical protein